jgi:hypothetical protein
MPGIQNTIKVKQIDTGNLVDFINSGLQSGVFGGNAQTFIPTGHVVLGDIGTLRTMDTTTLLSGTTVIVKSYYSNQSQGGGLFVWSPSNGSVDDSGRFITPNSGGGRWVRQIDIPNVYMWGARGNGSNDDTQAIQAALFSTSSGDYNMMRFPAGTFIISAPLNTSNAYLIEGEGSTSLVQAAPTYSGDFFRTNSASLFCTGGMTTGVGDPTNYGLFFDHNHKIGNLGMRGNDGATGSFITVFNVGEASLFWNLGCVYNGIGIRVIAGGAPGLRAINCQLSDCREASIKMEPFSYSGNYYPTFPATEGACWLESISSDCRNPAYKNTASVIKIVSGLITLNISNMKTEGQHGGGVVQYLTYPLGINDTIGHININGGSFNNTEGVPTGNKLPLVLLSGITASGIRTPNVTIHNVNLTAFDYLIADYAVKQSNGQPFLLSIDGAGGLSQGEARTPIYYHAIKPNTYAMRWLHHNGKLVSKFMPTGTGWYRVALNQHVRSLGGGFSIATSDGTGNSYVNFDTLLSDTTGYMKIRMCSNMVGRFVGLRGGWSTSGYGFLDIGITGSFPTGAALASNFVVVYHDVKGFESPNVDYSQLIDPYLITGFTEANTYVTQIDLNPNTLSEIQSPQTLISTGNIQVADIASLRAYNITGILNGTAVVVNSYYNSTRRGGGIFIWNTGNLSTDDSGRYITSTLQPNSGRWVRLFEGTPNVTMWGAKGDLATDDTKAIQAAFDAVGSGDFGEIVLSAGYYLISAPLVLGSCGRFRGESVLQCTLTGAPGYSGDILRTRQAHLYITGFFNSNPPFPYYDYGMHFSDFSIQMPENGSGAGFTLFQVGETTSLNNLYVAGGRKGVRVIGISAPGLRARQISVHGQSEAGITIEPYIISGVVGGNTNAVHLDTISSDSTNTGFFDNACIVKMVSGCGSLTLVNYKAEGHHGAGVVCYQYSGNDANLPIGYVHIEGGTSNCSTGSVPNSVVVITGTYGGTGPIRSPTVYLNGLNVYGMEYLIRDTLVKDQNNNPFGWRCDTAGGLGQAEARTPLIYNGIWGSRGTWTGALRNLFQNGVYNMRFTPATTGWYRIAVNGARNYFLGGRFSISTMPVNELTYFDFHTLLGQTTGSIKINAILSGSFTNPAIRISGVRVGWASGDYGFVDIAVTQAFATGTGLFTRDNFIKIDYYPLGTENAQTDNPSISDPTLITGLGGTIYTITKVLDGTAGADITAR